MISASHWGSERSHTKDVLASLPMALQEEKGKLIFQHPDHFQVHHIISNYSAVGKASQVTWTLN